MNKKYSVMFFAREGNELNTKLETVDAKSKAAVRMWSVAIGRERNWRPIKITELRGNV